MVRESRCHTFRLKVGLLLNNMTLLKEHFSRVTVPETDLQHSGTVLMKHLVNNIAGSKHQPGMRPSVNGNFADSWTKLQSEDYVKINEGETYVMEQFFELACELTG
eukprot:1150793_1